MDFSKLNINEDESLDKHSLYVCAKENSKQDGRFKPFDTLKSGTAHARHGNIEHNEISAAVEPKWSNSPTKPIPLKESLKLQEQHVRKLKVSCLLKLVALECNSFVVIYRKNRQRGW